MPVVGASGGDYASEGPNLISVEVLVSLHSRISILPSQRFVGRLWSPFYSQQCTARPRFARCQTAPDELRRHTDLSRLLAPYRNSRAVHDQRGPRSPSIPSGFWLAAQGEHLQERRCCLSAILELDPENEPARLTLPAHGQWGDTAPATPPPLHAPLHHLGCRPALAFPLALCYTP